MIMIRVNMIASTSMSDDTLKMLLLIADMAAMAITSVVANMAKWLD